MRGRNTTPGRATCSMPAMVRKRKFLFDTTANGDVGAAGKECKEALAVAGVFFTVVRDGSQLEFLS